MISLKLKHALGISILCALSLLSSGCSGLQELESDREVGFANPSRKPQSTGDKVTAIELQQDLQRFTSTFMARMYLAFQPQKEKVSPDIFHIMQSEGLSYASTALDIATGPNPEANLLDMMTFITLTRQSIEEYWIPNVYGNSGKEALEAFKKSEAEIWEIASKVSTQEQRNAYKEILREWKRDNPGRQRTESVRLAEIYRISGQASSDRSKKVSGLLGQIESVVASTDQAVLLSNRAMFLAQRAPFLLRIHAKIGAREVISESLEELGRSDQIFKGMKDLNPIIKDLTVLSANSERTFKSLEGVVKGMSLEKLTVMERIVTKANLTAETAMGAKPENATNLISEIRWQIERLIYVFLAVMLVIIAAWWLGYVWAKRKFHSSERP